MWYTDCMTKRPEELMICDHEGGMVAFSMRSITVDGMQTFSRNPFTGKMFSMKYEDEQEYKEDEHGYINDRAEIIAWDGAQWTIPHEEGEIDMDIWVYLSELMTESDSRYPEMKARALRHKFREFS